MAASFEPIGQPAGQAHVIASASCGSRRGTPADVGPARDRRRAAPEPIGDAPLRWL